MTRRQDQGPQFLSPYGNGTDNKTEHQYDWMSQPHQSYQGGHYDSDAPANSYYELLLQSQAPGNQNHQLFDQQPLHSLRREVFSSQTVPPAPPTQFQLGNFSQGQQHPQSYIQVQEQTYYPWNNVAAVAPASLRQGQHLYHGGSPTASISTSWDNVQRSEAQQQPLPLPAQPQQPQSFPWTCPHCGPSNQNGKDKNPRVCKNKNDWQKHINEHKKPSKCVWEGCAHKCASKNMLKRHVDSVHLHKANYICPINNCSHTNPRRDNFGGHLKRIHKWSDDRWDQERHRIKQCERSTRTRSRMDNASRSSQFQSPLPPAPPNPEAMEVDMTGSDLAQTGGWTESLQSSKGQYPSYDPDLVVEDTSGDTMNFGDGISEDTFADTPAGTDASAMDPQAWHENTTLDPRSTGRNSVSMVEVEDKPPYDGVAPYWQKDSQHANRGEFHQPPTKNQRVSYHQQNTDHNSSGAWSGFGIPSQLFSQHSTISYAGGSRHPASSTTYTSQSSISGFVPRTRALNCTELNPSPCIPPPSY